MHPVTSNLGVQTRPLGEGFWEHRLVLQLPAGPPIKIASRRNLNRVPSAEDVRALLRRADV